MIQHDSIAFLWQRYRQALPRSATATATASRWSVEALIAGIDLAREQDGLPAAQADALCKKLEVVRCLYQAYADESLQQRAGPPLDGKCVSVLACLLLDLFQRRKDFKFLNTVLKLKDYGLKQPSYVLPGDIGECAHRLLEQEALI
jgi:hypothetical protein